MSSRIGTLSATFTEEEVYLRNWSPRTVRTYRQGLSSLEQSLGDGGITKAQLDAWVVSLRKRGVTPGGVNMYVRTVNSFLTWLKENGHIEERLRVKLLPCPKSRPRRSPSPTSGARILAFRPQRFLEQHAVVLVPPVLRAGGRVLQVAGAYQPAPEEPDGRRVADYLRQTRVEVAGAVNPVLQVVGVLADYEPPELRVLVVVEQPRLAGVGLPAPASAAVEDLEGGVRRDGQDFSLSALVRLPLVHVAGGK